MKPTKMTQQPPILQIHMTLLQEGMKCATCGLVFSTVEDQRWHNKTDWHRFNVKRRLKGHRRVTEDEFEKMTDISSLSGSQSSSDSGSEEGEGALNIIKRPQPANQLQRSPKIVFVNPDGTRSVVYKNALIGEQYSSVQEGDLAVATGLGALKRATKAAVFLCSGGHFAGVVLDVTTDKVLSHKTIHRYTTRRKAGGSQSAHDSANAGHKAKSAGASLRRYNEMALAQDIRDTIGAWKALLDACEVVFITAPHSTRSIFIDSDIKAPFKKGDERLRRVPFMTRRPTFEEAQRVLRTVLAVGVDEMMPSAPEHKGGEEGQEGGVDTGEEKRLKELEIGGKRVRGGVEELDKGRGPEVVNNAMRRLEGQDVGKGAGAEEGQQRVVLRHSSEEPLFKAVEQGDLAKVMSILEGDVEEIEEVRVNEAFEDREGNTCLHQSAIDGQQQIVWVLLEAGACPTLVNLKGKVAYEVSKDKETRNVFRKFMGWRPDAWDWAKAKVPSPLTDEIEREQKEREKEKKKQRAKIKKEQDKIKRQEEEQAKREADVRKAQEEAARKIHEEDQRRKQEEEERTRKEREVWARLSDREKRARAAELRMSATKGGGTLRVCQQCGKSIVEDPFVRLEFSYCSTKCVKEHKEALDRTPPQM
mmetsp:Transcript_29807/g.48122  ORF Transcript_29807/g.48122 Transcript_29807/m.48122 type:complete len:644 (+) Transcript_29807:313-2244(+)